MVWWCCAFTRCSERNVFFALGGLFLTPHYASVPLQWQPISGTCVFACPRNCTALVDLSKKALTDGIGYPQNVLNRKCRRDLFAQLPRKSSSLWSSADCLNQPCSLTFVGPKVWSSLPDDIKPSTTFTCNWKLKKHHLHEKDTQLWTLATFHLSWIKYCGFEYFDILFIFYVYLFFRLLSCAHPILFGVKVHSIVFFCFALFFVCTSLISFCYFFDFF